MASFPSPFSFQFRFMEVGSRNAIDHDARVPSRCHTHSRPEPPPLLRPSMLLSTIAWSCSAHLCPAPGRTRPAQQPPPRRPFYGGGKEVEEGLAAAIWRLRRPLRQVRAGMLEDVAGWYHSHLGYACCLNAIDVSTQMLNQQFTELFLAVVIDPTKTVSAGKLDIGAFT